MKKQDYMTPQPITFNWAEIDREGIIIEAPQFECGYAIRFGKYNTSLVALDYATRKWSKEQLETIQKL